MDNPPPALVRRLLEDARIGLKGSSIVKRRSIGIVAIEVLPLQRKNEIKTEDLLQRRSLTRSGIWLTKIAASGA